MNEPMHTAHKTLTLGRWAMAFAALALLGAGMVAYAWADDFSLPVQIAAHLLMPVAAGLFKLGYVVRLASHQALGNLAAG